MEIIKELYHDHKNGARVDRWTLTYQAGMGYFVNFAQCTQWNDCIFFDLANGKQQTIQASTKRKSKTATAEAIAIFEQIKNAYNTE